MDIVVIKIIRPSSMTLAKFVGSVLSHSLNKAYLAQRCPAQIPLRGTSDPLGTLYDIGLGGFYMMRDMSRI